MDTVWKDVKHSLRMFAQHPAFTLAALAALAFGIGANTAVFSIVNTVLLRPLPFPDPDRVVMPVNTNKGNEGGPAASPAKFQHWREQVEVLEDVAAFRNSVVNYTGGEAAEQFRAAQVSSAFFRTFRVPIIQGRGFTEQEDLPSGPKLTLISENIWERKFGRGTDIVGRAISLSGNPYTVIGIVSSSFDMREFGPNPDVYMPFQLDPNTSDQGHYFQTAARLKPGVTLDQAKERLQASGEQYRTKFPLFNENNSFSVRPMVEVFVGNIDETLAVLGGAVGFVLLIACANVASLLLVRATGRRREIAIRAAIGAGRGRIVRQLMTESVLLSMGGGVLGLALGYLGIRTLLAVDTAGLPRVGDGGELIGMDWRVLLFTLGVSVLTGLIFGLIPALAGARTDLNTVLKDAGGRSGTGFRHNITRSVLVVAEVGLAVVLLVGAALLIRTSMALLAVDPGFAAANVLTMRMSLTGPQYQTAMGVERTVRNAQERIRAIPGVANVTATCCVPMQGGYGLPFIVLGRPLDGPSTGGAGWIATSVGYFDVFSIPVKRGRAFDERDDDKSPAVVVINETMAKQFWKDGDPLRDRIAIGRGVMREFADEPERQIIGVVGDVRHGGLGEEPGPMMYVPQAQVPDAANALNLSISPLAWLVKTRGGDAAAVVPAIREELRVATGLPVADIRPMDEIVSRSVARQRFNMLLMTIFGGVALLLAAIGIYGLMAYSVQQRTAEIGIRLALGAGTGQVRGMVVRQGMLLALAGVAIGGGAAWGLTKYLESFLFQVEARDPLVFVAAPIALTAVALAAVWIPARRASRIDPIRALRYE